jgi:YVTN family beta-propeller protein
MRPADLPVVGRWLRRTSRRGVVVLVGCALVLVSATTAFGALVIFEHAGPQGDGTAITSYGWHVTPAGRQTTLGERPYGMALSPDGRWLLVSNDGVAVQSVMLVEAATGRVRDTISYAAPEAVFLGVGFSPDGSRAYVSGGANDKVRVYDLGGGQLRELDPLRLATSGGQTPSFAGGLAVARDGRSVWVTGNLTNSVSVLDTSSGAERRIALSSRTCPVDAQGFDPSGGRDCLFPYTVVLSADGKTAYVSDWGQDSVSVIDVASGSVRGGVRVGTHPSAMTLSQDGDRLYVAVTDGDAIAVVDTRTNRLVRTFSVSPYPGARVGAQPNALALSPDGRTLYTANAGNNDLDVVRLAGGGHPDRVLGHIPTGWYPSAVAVAPEGSRLYVANARGLGAGPNPQGPDPEESPESTPDQYIGSMIKGTLSTIPVPDAATLARYTRQVVDNNGFAEAGGVRLVSDRQHVVPHRVGQRSPIEHVIYVVNENRTYDQVLGDLGRGNGDPSLALFGRDVAPNHHRLAEQFTTLDNLYTVGEVSMDGWEWSTGANANSLTTKGQPTNYGGRGYFYTGEGGTLGAAPGVNPADSYIWDRLSRAKLSFRNYGFWATGTTPAQVFNEPNLDANTDHQFPGFNMAISDQTRFAEWQREFRGYEQRGDLPSVEFVKFPRDHTCGTSPGCPTPKAMMADSDWALGQLVDSVSHSRFWKDTAIFVIEDDAQDGPDHVDAHRTVGHVISPYTQTGKVDSVFYSSVSMLRTMELILGLQPLTQYDAAANPMFNSFVDRPNTRPYDAIKPAQSLTEPNSPNAPLAKESASMDFGREDQAPEQLLNQAIWQSVKGADSTMPAPRLASQDRD